MKLASWSSNSSLRPGAACLAGIVGVGLWACSATGQLVTVGLHTPTLDRYMYQFNPGAGAETQASTFGAILQPGFDDRDAQFLVGWDLGSLVTPGQDLSRYRVRSLRVRATLSSVPRVVYDNTFDSVRSLYDVNDAEYVADSDAGGRPTELFGVGFRNGESATTFVESTAFANPLPPGPQEGIRSAFAAVYDDAGAATDISRQVRQRFEANPMAIGVTNAVQPGEILPQGAELTFDVNLCAPGVRAYVQRGLRQGRLLLMISSLQPASGGPGGGTGTRTYPAFFTKENPLAPAIDGAAKLDLVVNLGRVADFDGDGGVTIEDLLAYLGEYETGTAAADVTDDCGVTIEDLLVYLAAYGEG